MVEHAASVAGGYCFVESHFLYPPDTYRADFLFLQLVEDVVVVRYCGEGFRFHSPCQAYGLVVEGVLASFAAEFLVLPSIDFFPALQTFNFFRVL